MACRLRSPALGTFYECIKIDEPVKSLILAFFSYNMLKSFIAILSFLAFYGKIKIDLVNNIF